MRIFPAVILVYARDSMAGESVYGPHDYLVGEGAGIAEAGEPAFFTQIFVLTMSYRLRIEAYAGRRQLNRFYLRDD